VTSSRPCGWISDGLSSRSKSICPRGTVSAKGQLVLPLESCSVLTERTSQRTSVYPAVQEVGVQKELDRREVEIRCASSREAKTRGERAGRR
jgi:hypothetical protein